MEIKKIFFCCLLWPTLLLAGERNDLPSCYDFFKISEMRPPSSGRELVFIIDETITLPKALKTSVYKHVMRYIQPGDRLRLYRISAFMPNSFLQLEYAVTLENIMRDKDRDNVGMNVLHKLDTCLDDQQSEFKNKLVSKMIAIFGNKTKNIAKSEILFSLQQISQDIQSDGISRRVMFLVSDMLENSSFTSFYANNQIKNINVSREFKKVQENNLLSDLSDWHVYVEGAGLGTHNSKYGYRSGKTIQSLEEFWKTYFEASGAILEGFGAPALTTELN